MSRMKKLITIICLLSLILTSFTLGEKGDKNCIRWSADRKLRISDFTIVEYPLPDNASAKAFTGIVMEYYANSPSKYRAYAIFDTIKSVWNVNAVINKYRVLLHEQTHFDIAQYITNQLNIELFKSETTPRLASRIYMDFQYKLDSMQVLYDKEILNYTDSTAQERWSKKVWNLIMETPH